jgi:hypothetical protein
LPLRRLITPLGRTCQFENFRIISWNKNPRQRIWQFKEDVTMKASAGRIAHFYSEAIADSGPAGLRPQWPGDRSLRRDRHAGFPRRRIFQGSEYANLEVIGWGFEAWDQGSVSRKPLDGESSRYWIWPRPAIERSAATPLRPLCGLFFLQDCRTALRSPWRLKNAAGFLFPRYVRDGGRSSWGGFAQRVRTGAAR